VVNDEARSVDSNRDDDDPDDDVDNGGKAGRPDFLDFLIKVLNEHEQQLSSTTENLGELYDRMKRDRESSTEILTEIAKEIEETVTHPAKRQLVIHCNRWADMKRNRKNSRIVTFDTRENRFVVTMVADEIYEYVEPMPTKTLRVRNVQSHYVLDGFIIDDLERVPHLFKNTLDCGLNGMHQTTNVDLHDGRHIVTMQFTIDRQTAITFLAKELQIPETKVIEGRMRLLN
jgi:hypothetical protein